MVADSGGGIYNWFGTVSLSNSTFDGNSANIGGIGGGISNSDGLTVNNCTISGNLADGGSGGGIYQDDSSGSLTLDNSIVADNTSDGSPSDILGPITANSSLIGNSTGATIIGGDGKNILDQDPLLGSLGDYGGPTQTIPLLPGSPAIDAGDNSLIPSGVTTDQRGYARIVNGTVDIGAIQKLSPTVTWSDPADITYGTALDSTQLDATADVEGTFAYMPASGSVLHAGNNQTLSVIFTPTDTIDYTTVTKSVSINVNPALLTITADNQTKLYGDPLPTLTATYSGFVNDDTPASLTTPPALTTTATAGSHVSGSPYSITASGAVDPDYTISYVPGTLTVTPSPLTITANNQTKEYGAALPTLTASYSGFVNDDTPASLTTPPALSTTATTGSHVSGSPYSITASGAVDPDYTIGYVPGTLTVTPASLTITADNQTKEYGAALPTLTASYSGFVNDDTPASLTTPPALSTTATTGSHVSGSPYSITASGAVDPDYTISYVPGTLTVTPASLTITADNQTKEYGAALPTLTVSYSGFVNGETLSTSGVTGSPSLACTATPTSPVGSYPITVGLGTLAAENYSFTLVDGTLAVTPDATPPQATLNALNVTASGATTYTFTVTYTDDVAVNVSTLDGSDVVVTGPNSFSQAAAFVGVDINSNGTPRMATYQITAPGGTWDASDNGTYTVSMQSNQVGDTGGNYVSSGALGTFMAVVPNSGPVISKIVVVTSQGKMNWNVQDPDGVKSASLTVDGEPASKINGPYTAAAGVNFSGIFGTLSVGTYNYIITATDKLGNSSQYTGTFNVTGPTIGSVVVVATKSLMTWNAQDSDGVTSASLTVDGKTVSPIHGPYTAAAGVNFSGVFGGLSAGTHNYTITAIDKLGNSSQYTRAFNVTGPTIGSVVVVIAQGKMTWNGAGSRRREKRQSHGRWKTRVADSRSLYRRSRCELLRVFWNPVGWDAPLHDHGHQHTRQLVAIHRHVQHHGALDG